MECAIFGAGKAGIKLLNKLDKEKVKFFIDNNRSGEICGVPIKTLEEIGDENRDILVLISSNTYKHEMIEQLQEVGLKNYLCCDMDIVENDNKNRLSEKQWGELYNEEMLNEIIKRIKDNHLSLQSRELIKLTQTKDKVLEIGCGSGESSVILAKNDRIVSAIDYSADSISLVNKLAEKMECNVETYCIDAIKELPFEDREFDVVFQAGLLEHFNQEQRIQLLNRWKRVCKKMVSLIPNEHSVAYRTGKAIAEKNRTWKWGLELPQYSLVQEFQEAGLSEVEEYTIGEKEALDFLPENHYLRVALEKWLKEGYGVNDCGQGYLLVTIGKNTK